MVWGACVALEVCNPDSYIQTRYILKGMTVAMQATRKETPVSMRFRNEDLAVIDRGAALLGLSRTEFVRRAALHDAQLAMLSQTVVRVSSNTYADFLAAID